MLHPWHVMPHVYCNCAPSHMGSNVTINVVEMGPPNNSGEPASTMTYQLRPSPPLTRPLLDYPRTSFLQTDAPRLGNSLFLACGPGRRLTDGPRPRGHAKVASQRPHVLHAGSPCAPLPSDYFNCTFLGQCCRMMVFE